MTRFTELMRNTKRKPKASSEVAEKLLSKEG